MGNDWTKEELAQAGKAMMANGQMGYEEFCEMIADGVPVIERFEQAIRDQKSAKEAGINRMMYMAYQTAKETGNQCIDFDEGIWLEDIEAIATICREHGITEFTISSNYSGLIATLAAFATHGWHMAVLTQVKARYADWSTGKPKMIDAIRMEVCS
jgi:hypothetical protein